MKVKPLFPILSFFIIAAASSPVVAQIDMDDFFDSADDEFLELKQQAEEEFDELSKLDKEFAETLERAWKELELSTGMAPDSTPKPDKIPVARPSEMPEPSPTPEPAPIPEPVQHPEPSPIPEPSPEPEPVPPPAPEQDIIQQQLQLPENKGTQLSVDFFNTSVTANYDKALKVTLTGGVSEKTISAFWEKISATDYENFLGQFENIRRRLGLNDWGYCLLLDSVSEGIYGSTAIERPLFIWFMLIKSGYDARAGFNNNRTYLLIPSDNTVYSIPFYEIGSRKYYLTFMGTSEDQVQSLFTYEGNYETASERIDFTLYSPPEIGRSFATKKYSFRYGGNTYNLSVQVNKTIVDFYENYPQTNLNVYFTAPITTETSDALLEELRSIIRNKPEEEAVNIILRFVQTAFDYQTDDVQFAREKFLFTEETLYYPYSDCEDRSILFAFLITRLLGLAVVGLDYPGHIATAVLFTKDVEGDALSYNDKKYIICDPTYINARYGECMPQFKTVAPEIIPVNIKS